MKKLIFWFMLMILGACTILLLPSLIMMIWSNNSLWTKISLTVIVGGVGSFLLARIFE